MKRLLWVLSLVVFSTVFFSGCGGGKEKQAETKNSFTFAYYAEISTLDANHRVGPGDIWLTRNIFDTLINYQSDKVEYRIARSYKISDDQKEYTFYLRDDVYFHDGTNLTARDVAYSIEDCRTSEVQSMYAEGISSTEIVNDYEIIIKADEPSGLILYNLNSLLIVPAEIREKIGPEAFGKNPVGSGPYKFISWDVSGKVEIEAYDKYILGTPPIKHITALLIIDEYARTIALENNEIDFARLSETGYATIKDNPKLQTYANRNFLITFILLNVNKKPFDNVKVRQAIAYAVNREMMYKIRNPETGEVNSIMCPKAVYGYTPDIPVYDYNPEKARQLLVEAGIKTPYDIGTIDVWDSLKGLAEVYQNNLGEIGLTATINVIDFATYFKMGAKGELNTGVFSGSWGFDLGHYFELWGTYAIGSMNWTGYSNSDLDKYMNAGIHNTVDSVRRENYKKALEILQAQVPLIHLYDCKTVYGATKDLDIPFYPDGDFSFANITWK
jgi:peptide/nickel transport system substrate-binding protein